MSLGSKLSIPEELLSFWAWKRRTLDEECHDALRPRGHKRKVRKCCNFDLGGAILSDEITPI